MIVILDFRIHLSNQTSLLLAITSKQVKNISMVRFQILSEILKLILQNFEKSLNKCLFISY